MKKVLLLVVIFVFFTIEPVFGEVDLSNQKISSLNGNFILEFSENSEKITRDKIIKTTNLDYGIIKLPGNTIFLDHDRVNILANSFAVHMDNGIIYAKNNRDGTFNIKVLTFENGKFVKDIFSAKIEPRTKQLLIEPSVIEPEKQLGDDILKEYWAARSPSIREADKERIVEVEEYDPDTLDLILSVPKTIQWKHNLNFDVTAIDTKIKSEKDQRMADVYVKSSVIDPFGEIIDQWTDYTNQFGGIEFSLYIPDNMVIGEYTLKVIADMANYTSKTSSVNFFVIPLDDSGGSPLDPCKYLNATGYCIEELIE